MKKLNNVLILLALNIFAFYSVSIFSAAQHPLHSQSQEEQVSIPKSLFDALLVTLAPQNQALCEALFNAVMATQPQILQAPQKEAQVSISKPLFNALSLILAPQNQALLNAGITNQPDLASQFLQVQQLPSPSSSSSSALSSSSSLPSSLPASIPALNPQALHVPENHAPEDDAKNISNSSDQPEESKEIAQSPQSSSKARKRKKTTQTFICPICKEEVAKHSNHISKTHPKHLDSLICLLCKEENPSRKQHEYTSQNILLRHIRTIHAKEEDKYTCEKCGKTEKRSDIHNEHIKTCKAKRRKITPSEEKDKESDDEEANDQKEAQALIEVIKDIEEKNPQISNAVMATQPQILQAPQLPSLSSSSSSSSSSPASIALSSCKAPLSFPLAFDSQALLALENDANNINDSSLEIPIPVMALSPDQIEEIKEITQSFTCPICNTKVPMFRSHISNIHYDFLKNPFICKLCPPEKQHQFRGADALLIHIMCVHKNEQDWYKCEKCGKKRKNSNAYKRHIKTCNGQVSQLPSSSSSFSLKKSSQEFICPICNKKAAKGSTHIADSHPDYLKAPFICKLCPQKKQCQLTTVNILLRHIMTIHRNKQDWYTCEKCGKTEKRFAHYNKHIQTCNAKKRKITPSSAADEESFDDEENDQKEVQALIEVIKDIEENNPQINADYIIKNLSEISCYALGQSIQEALTKADEDEEPSSLLDPIEQLTTLLMQRLEEKQLESLGKQLT